MTPALAIGAKMAMQTTVLVAAGNREEIRLADSSTESLDAPLRWARGTSSSKSSERRHERRLITSAQSGSVEALEELYRRHWRLALRAAYLVVHDTAAAEDIAQEAFLSALRALERFDRRRPFGPWLNRIVVNRSIDWARSRALRREVELEAEPQMARREVPEGREIALDGPVSEPVMAALAGLSPEHRAVVVLRFLFEYNPGEIARLLDLPRGTVNSRLRRALDHMATEVDREQG
jgi:RNA polymerase sigma-70 factor (ECF subfamily)